MKVTTRIAAGYGLVVLLSVVIAGVGYLGLQNINKNLDSVLFKSLPLVDATVRLQVSLLKTQEVMREINVEEKLAGLDSDIKKYQGLQADNEQAHTDLLGLVDGDLKPIMEAITQARRTQKSAIEQLLVSHRELILKHQASIENERTVKDTADALVVTSAGAKSATGHRIANMTDDFVNHVNGAKDLKIKGAVLAKRKSFQSELDDIEFLTKALGSSGTKVQQSFQRLSDANGKWFDTRLAELDLIKKDNESIDAADAAGQVVLKNVDAFTKVIRERTGLLDASSEETVSASKTMIIGFSALAIMASLMIAFMIIQSIRKPLEKIVAGVKQVAAGDLRTQFEVNGSDELAELSGHMQNLATNMRNIVSEINGGCIQLSATAEETATISDIGFKNINEQKEQTSMIATATEELTATVEEVARSIAMTLSEVEKVCDEVKDGERVLNGNISRIKDLSSDVEHGASVIHRLSQDTNNINSILDTITSVAEQTNLLALNAAIEAARAGEQGRGFAVVADEVRALAARAQQSTAEIKDMIARLQSGTQEAVETMNKSRDSAQHSVVTIAEAGDKLSQISKMMDTIRNMSLQIASASEEQTSVTRDQLKRITAIADVSEKNADGARESNAASKDLARMAEGQRMLIGNFKV